MSTARHHAEWLSLVEASGPFVSMPVLLKAFPQGLDAHDSEVMRLVRLAHDEWQVSQQAGRLDQGIHGAWVAFVLREVLGFPEEVLLSGQAIPSRLAVTVAEQGETLRPDWIISEAIAPENKARMLVQVYPPGQDLNKAVKGSRWAASAATRMMELLHGLGVRLGLVTNGEHWLLVNAPKGEATGYISWYATLWQEEKLTLRAFRSLLGVERFFGVDESETIEALLAESVNSQQEVTDQLGFQVRSAVEVLVQSIDRADQDRGRELLVGVLETKLYEAALTVMMRLVFLFSAEERGLLLLGDPVYDQFYAVSTLREMLREQADQNGEEILERRYDAWCRLLAIFRAVYGGIGHEALRLPAYGGTLFDPDRFEFLEGRESGSRWQQVEARPIEINNRTVLHLLEALQLLEVQMPGGGGKVSRKISFRALDIEQIGHVYEGLLDHTAVRAMEPILGLVGTKNKEPEVALEDLEQLAQKDGKNLLTFLKKETGRSQSALKKSLEMDVSAEWGAYELSRLRVACGNDEALYARVLPFAGLLRADTFGYPVAIARGSVYVTQGSDRRDTGTHYTPRSLTEEIVKYTLEPLVYVGVAEGRPKEKWKLKKAPELLKLKVCDMAMGSGAFLVEVCRYLSARLVEAWESEEGRIEDGEIKVLPDGSLSTGDVKERLLPADPEERMIMARRLVADRCLYGVDKNPLAVEMAKLSLWLITLQKHKPFTFLDHAFRCGDSLVGVSVEQLCYWNMDTHETTPELLASSIRAQVEEVSQMRQKLESISVDAPADQAEKERLLGLAQTRMNGLQLGADQLVTSYFVSSKKSRQDDVRQIMLQAYRGEGDVPEELRGVLERNNVQPFHWELEFPEVFAGGGGFDAIVGNPPFQGGQKITGALGTVYRDFLVEQIAQGARGSADLCAYFFLRADEELRVDGGMGLIATNTIAQGDTREVGLDQLAAKGRAIPRAVPSRKWPGSANLEVAHIWVKKGKWAGGFELNEKWVEGITPFLTIPGQAVGNPERLAANQEKSFQGSIVLGMGFVLEPEEAQALIEKDACNADVLFPYLNGQDLNTNSDQSPSRWVINFFDWPLDAEHDDSKKPKGPPYAADYPDCLTIVREKVKPEREVNKYSKSARERWWLYERSRPELYGAIEGCDRVLASTRVTKYFSVSVVPNNQIFTVDLAIHALSPKFFSLLSSNIFETWTRETSSTMETRLRFSITDSFETFPFPTQTNTLESIGEAYYTHRQSIMQTHQQGLTKTYNRFHTPDDTAPDITQLRSLHIEMDTAVAAAYGWQDLALDHDFHETKQGLRFTISEAARREVLDRLLALNHERYTQEVKLGLHDKKKGKKAKSKKVTPQREALPEDQMKLFF
ncbi:type IIL restriction-modification enzyme MmeI [Leptolyngbya sp. BC1307]|uniref:Eco57I restriction-modification methylase domain-containing protein n=1 Tax=Leptolyngbya sp. BC1307 TaxID=2029589 RepID=UPI000EFC6B50|nr:type IIL restriction-modification enzyme MmeI [Leptolyngbya sp. BC1307]